MNVNGNCIQGIFFDLYGTLLIYEDVHAGWNDWADSFYACLPDAEPSLVRETFDRAVTSFFSKDIALCAPDGFTVFERRISRVLADLRITGTRQFISRIADKTICAFQKYITLDPDAIPVLSALKKKYTLALITNYDHPPHMRRYLHELALDCFFDSIVISAETGFMKPSPEIFSIALEQTGLGPGSVIYIGDTPIDVTGARNAGIFPVLIQREKSNFSNQFETDLSRELEDMKNNGVCVIRSLNELLKMQVEDCSL